MKVLVTGGSGVIGSYLLRKLSGLGYELSCYSRSKPNEDHADWVQGDIGQLDQLKAACKGHDAVIHLAAIPGPGRKSPEELMQVNVMGTVHALESATASGVQKFVFASSGAATGFSFQTKPIIPDYLPIDEDHACAPQDEYGLSKLIGEQICKRYTNAHGLATICLRINHNWCLDREGADVAVQCGWAKGLTVEEFWQKRYLKVIIDPDGDWPTPGPPSPNNLLWAVTDVRDAIQAFRLALENTEITHEVFLINADDTCSKTQTADLIGHYFPRVSLKAKLEGYASLVSHAKATRMLGYHPRYTWRNSDFSKWLQGAEQEANSDGTETLT